MTEAQAAFTPIPDKRTHDQVEASPSTEPPPSSRPRHDSTDFNFVDQFLTAVSDPRVVSSLVKTLLKPMLAELKQKDEKLEQLTAEVQELKKEVHVLKTASTRHEEMLDEHEQYSRRNSLRIWSKEPETKEENTDDIVMAYAEKVGVKLSPWDIGRSHRVGKPTQDKSRPIIVKFSTYGARSRVYGARKQCQDVYVSEDLTRRRSHLLYLARVERKAGRFKHCWSHDGRILVRLHDDRVRGVTTTGELDKLVNETPVGHH